MHRSIRLVIALVLVAPLFAALPPATAVRAASATSASAATATEAKPVEINSASSETLQTIPGVGKSLAQRIIAFREKNGAFQSVDDLVKVQGIGEKSLQKLRPYVTVAKSK